MNDNGRQEWLLMPNALMLACAMMTPGQSWVTINGSCSKSSAFQSSGTLSRHRCHKACRAISQEKPDIESFFSDDMWCVPDCDHEEDGS
eukprot:1496111-Karenia_brevis.AAC.1